jgi:anti-sigma factor RsiW
MATEEFMDRSLQHAFDAEQVMAYFDGELEPQRAAMLAGHLEHCAECQSVAKQMRLISGRMLNFEIEPMPENVAAAVLAELHRPDRPAPARPRSRGHRIGAKWRESKYLGSCGRVCNPRSGSCIGEPPDAASIAGARLP